MRASTRRTAAAGRAENVREFLRSLLAPSTSVPIPDVLRAMARRFVRGAHAHGAEDLVQDLVAELLTSTSRENAGSVHTLLGMEDEKLLAAVARRVRQVAAERSARWGLRKQLRQHVASALERRGQQQGDIENDGWPADLTLNGKLSGKAVQRAVEAALPEMVHVSGFRISTEITRLLMHRYFPMEAQLDGVPEATPALYLDGVPDKVRRELDSPVIEHMIRSQLGEDLLRIVTARLGDKTFEQIAASEKLALATVHKRWKTAIMKLKDASGAEGMTWGMVAKALSRIGVSPSELRP